MPSHDLESEMRAALVSAMSLAGLPPREATLLRLHSNAIFVVADLGLLVRIATNPDALPGATAAVRVTRWLASRGYRCTVPASVPDQPFVIDGRIVTFWRYLTVVDQPRPTPADLGHLLRELHYQPPCPQPPPAFTDPFSSVSAALHGTPRAMSDTQREWLVARIEQLRALWWTTEFPHPRCLIHGDAHDNNLMRTTDGIVLLGDWDHVAIGPREWDLGQPHYTHRRFGRPGGDGLDEFAEAYGWDIRDWPGLDVLIAIREITGLAPYIRTSADRPGSATELSHRLSTLEEGQTEATWTPPARA